jgi:hypothetical protein
MESSWSQPNASLQVFFEGPIYRQKRNNKRYVVIVNQYVLQYEFVEEKVGKLLGWIVLDAETVVVREDSGPIVLIPSKGCVCGGDKASKLLKPWKFTSATFGGTQELFERLRAAAKLGLSNDETCRWTPVIMNVFFPLTNGVHEAIPALRMIFESFGTFDAMDDDLSEPESSLADLGETLLEECQGLVFAPIALVACVCKSILRRWLRDRHLRNVVVPELIKKVEHVGVFAIRLSKIGWFESNGDLSRKIYDDVFTVLISTQAAVILFSTVTSTATRMKKVSSFESWFSTFRLEVDRVHHVLSDHLQASHYEETKRVGSGLLDTHKSVQLLVQHVEELNLRHSAVMDLVQRGSEIAQPQSPPATPVCVRTTDVEVWEFQRFFLLQMQWKPIAELPDRLLYGECTYSNRDRSTVYRAVTVDDLSAELKAEWAPSSAWAVDITVNPADQGWEYRGSFGRWRAHYVPGVHLMRRRKWIRKAVCS